MCTFVRNFVLAVLSTSPYSINAGGELLSLEEPVVMGILNATPDSFYKHEEGAEALAHHALQMLEEGHFVCVLTGQHFVHVRDHLCRDVRRLVEASPHLPDIPAVHRLEIGEEGELTAQLADAPDRALRHLMKKKR